MGTAVLIAVFLRTFVAQAFYIPSGSMEPQLGVGDRIVVSKLAYDLHEPRRGDILVFDCPPAADCADEGRGGILPLRLVRAALEVIGLRPPSTEEYVKRVVALPGETVQARGGRILIDGEALIEPYLPDEVATADFDPVVVGPGELWVMGDNRANSSDSRRFGTIDVDSVVGRVIFRIWPPQRAAFL